MKTFLVEEVSVAGFDTDLLKALPQGLPYIGVESPMRIAVKNEYGAIYRIIETGDVVSNKKLLDDVRQMGFFVESNVPENEHSFWAIVKGPL
ncbi:hypothetical protein [Noviherbaspirillum malthae]|uniref:hypothetical protein n=1 Tax=Noviherbaspirillum malthae TaxID=1260987 RepID=UPI0018908BE7|nr:hypothetical protein [Noviherbaspirillum malthae]